MELKKNFAKRWSIALWFRAAYEPSGNGIVERNHLTIKRIAERGGITPEEGWFWYNVSPHEGNSLVYVPSSRMFLYHWKLPDDTIPVEDGREPKQV